MCKDCGCGEDNGVVTKVFTVPGMMCNNCKETVEGASLGLPGVLSAEVDWAYLNALIKDIVVGATGEAYIIDERGTLIANKKIEKELGF